MRWSTLGVLIGALPGLLLGGCSAVGLVNALAPRDTWHVLADQAYGTKGQRLARHTTLIVGALAATLRGLAPVLDDMESFLRPTFQNLLALRALF
ncbi:hypothetical protein [Cupriavidus basilensis]|uniref:Uncharacterized protein n=1 Tax=Cupriavidus basilensis TaxID=68895 RepID=A0A7M2H933_9BURK|nr:hypothetical protein [Cupriavidus basilensis]QOT81536.1 hypothetical protein F7R26_032710 [Cupriavidus basilensis]